MATINLTAGNDVYTQPESDRDVWNTINGLGGDDIIRAYSGGMWGGPGNDRIEIIPIAGQSWRQIHLGYGDGPSAVRVDLELGVADDGWGTRDTFVGAYGATGGQFDDWFKGDAKDNGFWPGNGNDTVFGGGGNDTVGVPWFEPAGQPWRQTLFSDLDISVSVDGLSATIRPKNGKGFVYTVHDVEYVEVALVDNGPWQRFQLTDFISYQDMAQQAVAAGGNARWNAASPMGTAVSLSFSFVTEAPASGPGASGFRAFTAAEQQMVRDMLAATASMSGLSFSEVAESGTSVGQLRFGASQQTASKGVAYLPGQNGDQAGDVWMDVDSLAGIAPGTEGYAALLHEIGHALGLRHPRNVDAGDAWTTQLREQDDRTALTVMSQHRSSDGLFRSDWGPLDVLALRHLYGSKVASAGNTHYELGALQGASQTSIVDDGGIDTLDASALTTGVNFDLTPGRLGSAGITPAGFSGVDNLGLTAGTLIEHAVGSRFDDVLLGNAAANTLTGGLGNDWIDGSAGIDTAAFAGRRSDYELSNEFGKLFVKARDGVSGFDTLLNIERLQFSDQTISLSPTVLGNDARFTLDEDSRLSATLPAPGDLAAGTVSYRIVGSAQHGSASISPAGQLNYTPAANFHGIDTLSFDIVANSGGASNRYVAFIDVLPVNDAAPVSRDGSFVAPSSSVMNGRLPAATDIDGDTLSYALGTDPRNGAVAVASDGSFAYTPGSGFRGEDSFTWLVSDGMGGTATYNARVQVVPVTQALRGTEGKDTMGAQAGSDGYSGLGGADTITGGPGDDLIDGGDGTDTSVHAGPRGQYQLSRTDYGWTIADSTRVEGTDRLSAIERLKFADTSLAIDLEGNAGMVAEILRALFGKSFLGDRTVVGIGLLFADQGMSYPELVSLALGTDLFAALAGGRSNTAFVNAVYKNVVGAAPGPADLANYVGLLDSGAHTQVSLGLLASQISFNADSVELVGLAGAGLEFLPAG